MYQNGKYTFKTIYSGKTVLITVDANSESDGKSKVTTLLNSQGTYPSQIDLTAYEDISKVINFPSTVPSTQQYPNYTGQSAESWLQQIQQTLAAMSTTLKEIKEGATKATF